MGNVLQAGEGQAPTRQALLGAGMTTLAYFHPRSRCWQCTKTLIFHKPATHVLSRQVGNISET